MEETSSKGIIMDHGTGIDFREPEHHLTTPYVDTVVVRMYNTVVYRALPTYLLTTLLYTVVVYLLEI